MKFVYEKLQLVKSFPLKLINFVSIKSAKTPVIHKEMSLCHLVGNFLNSLKELPVTPTAGRCQFFVLFCVKIS